MTNITIYTTTSCPYCKMAKAFFQESGLQYTEKDVTTDIAAQQEMIEKSGALAVPVIDIDGQIIVGFSKEKLKEFLKI